MFGLCIESSHQKGMGHLFRQANFASFLKQTGESFIFLVNEDGPSIQMLADRRLPYDIVDFTDDRSAWEARLIKKHGITCWVDDRLNTDLPHAQAVKKTGAALVVLDDRGSGASQADFNISALAFEGHASLPGKQVFRGTEYLILNPEIDKYKRARRTLKKLVVTLGGSDTYDVTSKVVDLLCSSGRSATIVLGPSYRSRAKLEAKAGKTFEVKMAVSSLIAELANYDLAICGGGITPFEANASGLPCIIVANETFEIPNGQYLEKLGSSVFAGHHEKIQPKWFEQMERLDIAAMSAAGLSHLDTRGAERIYEALKPCLKSR